MNNLRFLYIGAAKDAAMVRRDPFGLLIPIGIPLVLALMMNMVFGSSGQAKPQGVLLIADEDQSFASSMVTGIFSRQPLAGMVSVKPVSRADGRAAIDRGQASAFLIVPHGLQDAAMGGRPATLQLFTNPSERIIPQIVADSLSMAIDVGPSMPAIAPLVQLQSTKVAKRDTVNFASLFFPSMIFLSLMMVANSLASEVWKERLAGTLRRLAATPVPLAWYLAGRLLFAAFVLLCIGAVGVAGVHWMAGVSVPDFPGAVAWVIFSGCALYLSLLFLVMGAQSPRTANIMGNMLIFPLAMVGGCFFPFEIMPSWMASVGRMTPNGWAVLQFNAILNGSVSAVSFAGSAAGLLAVSVAAFLLVSRRLRREFLL